jgi:hypothetical protein
MLGGLDSSTHGRGAVYPDRLAPALHSAAELGVCSQTAGIARLADWRFLALSGRRLAVDGVLRDLLGHHIRADAPTRFRHGWVHRVAANQALVILNPPVADAVGRVRAAAEAWHDVAIADTSDSFEAMAVVGPGAAGVAAAASDCRNVTIVRSLEVEFLLLAAKSEAPVLWQALLRAGVPHGAHPVRSTTIALLAAARKVLDCQRQRSDRALASAAAD